MEHDKLRHFFGLCSYEYCAGYYRICTVCGDERPGWGVKCLDPGDYFETLHQICALSPETRVNPDHFRKLKN